MHGYVKRSNYGFKVKCQSKDNYQPFSIYHKDYPNY